MNHVYIICGGLKMVKNLIYKRYLRNTNKITFIKQMQKNNNDFDISRLKKPLLLRQHHISNNGKSHYCLDSIYHRIQGDSEKTQKFIRDLIEFANRDTQTLLKNELKADERFQILWPSLS